MVMDLSLRDRVGRRQGRHLRNNIGDQGTVMFLLNSISDSDGGTRSTAPDGTVVHKDFAMAVPGMCKDDLHDAIRQFQLSNFASLGIAPDGNISPAGPTLRRLNLLADPVDPIPKPRPLPPIPPPVFPPSVSGQFHIEVSNIVANFQSTIAKVAFFQALAGIGDFSVFTYEYSGNGLGAPTSFNPTPYTGKLVFPGNTGDHDDPFSGPANLEFLSLPIGTFPVASGTVRMTVTLNKIPPGGTEDQTFLATRNFAFDLPSGGFSFGSLTLKSRTEFKR